MMLCVAVSITLSILNKDDLTPFCGGKGQKKEGGRACFRNPYLNLLGGGLFLEFDN